MKKILIAEDNDSNYVLMTYLLKKDFEFERAKNGQIAVTAQVPGADELMDGMNVRITVENSVPNQMVVPKSAVVIRDNMEVLFRIDPETGHSLWTYVNVLMSNTTEHVVEANKDRGAELNVGDRIITSGNLNLGDDAEVVIE